MFALFPKLQERRKQVVNTMSGGEQQMVAIGRAMMSNPAFLTLDEPSLRLSPLLCKGLIHSLMAVRDTGIGILLVEQNAKQSLAIVDRGYLQENAHIVHEDSAAVLISDPAVQTAYLGEGGGETARTVMMQRPSQRQHRPAAVLRILRRGQFRAWKSWWCRWRAGPRPPRIQPTACRGARLLIWWNAPARSRMSRLTGAKRRGLRRPISRHMATGCNQHWRKLNRRRRGQCAGAAANGNERVKGERECWIA